MKTLSLLAALLISTHVSADDHVKVTNIILAENNSRLCLLNFEKHGSGSQYCKDMITQIESIKSDSVDYAISVGHQHTINQLYRNIDKLIIRAQARR